jgi:aspartate/methionine/tyrosine aminotransferase
MGWCCGFPEESSLFHSMGEGHVRFGLVENEHRIRQATTSIQRFLKTGLD